MRFLRVSRLINFSDNGNFSFFYKDPFRARMPILGLVLGLHHGRYVRFDNRCVLLRILFDYRFNFDAE